MKHHKSLYELIKEAACQLGEGGKTFTADQVIAWIRESTQTVHTRTAA